MHLFKIIHADIKPSNIAYSQKRQKYVFIDFGLSKIINEDYGYKSLTYFKGSPEFCSPEMI